VWSPNNVWWCLVAKHLPLGQPFGPGQTGNVWRPNTIKHCLVTTRANVEVSGQTVKTCLIKHKSNNWYKPLSERGTHARIRHVWYAAVQTNKTSPIKHESRRNNLSFWSNVSWPSIFFKHDQVRSNTIKQHQTRCLNGKMFVHQTMFDGVWSLNISPLSWPFRMFAPNCSHANIFFKLATTCNILLPKRQTTLGVKDFVLERTCPEKYAKSKKMGFVSW